MSSATAAAGLIESASYVGDNLGLLAACAVGLIAGAHTATWGMYKDAVHEGFTWRKYLRSVSIGGCIAPLLYLAGVPLGSVGDMLVLFGVTYVLERAASEFYKTFLRNEDQSKYFIPMQFAVRGRVVKSRLARVLVGVDIAAALFLLALTVFLMQPDAGRPALWLVALTGSWAGLVSAVGGAWKDAPIEGFETFKFFRSPVVATIYAVLLSSFTSVLLLTALAGLGFTVATLETYKTFFFPSKPRGKFAGKPIRFPEMLTRRNWFVPMYASIWALVLAGFALAY
ncbi:MAG: hypothetical protein WEE89_00085 [Gemmatimonadota bacterium]